MIRKINKNIHLWLGLFSGIIVFIVCITGCIYVFKNEINDLREPWKFVEPLSKTILLPSEAITIANTETGSYTPASITYGEATDAIEVSYFESYGSPISTVFINPCSGEVIKSRLKNPSDFDFFSFILKGHRTLWLPREIGKPLVGYSVLLFIIILISGIILWWPKKWNKGAAKRNFTIKPNASFVRINFDLHKVIGGYVAVILLLMSLTGLVWSFNWYSEGVYKLTGGTELKPYILPQSDSLQLTNHLHNPLDQLYTQLRQQAPNAANLYFALPKKTDDCIRVSLVHERGSIYKTDNLFFDQYTLQPLEGQGPYAGKYKDSSTPDKIRRMNMDIHTGNIGGLFGKILAFIASLTGASLPVTGCILFYRRFIKRNKLARSTLINKKNGCTRSFERIHPNNNLT